MHQKESVKQAKAMSLAECKATLAQINTRLAEIEQIAENNHQVVKPWEIFNVSPLALEHWGLCQRRIALQTAIKR
jgi:hypothetical protein